MQTHRDRYWPAATPSKFAVSSVKSLGGFHIPSLPKSVLESSVSDSQRRTLFVHLLLSVQTFAEVAAGRDEELSPSSTPPEDAEAHEKEQENKREKSIEVGGERDASEECKEPERVAVKEEICQLLRFGPAVPSLSCSSSSSHSHTHTPSSSSLNRDKRHWEEKGGAGPLVQRFGAVEGVRMENLQERERAILVLLESVESCVDALQKEKDKGEEEGSKRAASASSSVKPPFLSLVRGVCLKVDTACLIISAEEERSRRSLKEVLIEPSSASSRRPKVSLASRPKPLEQGEGVGRRRGSRSRVSTRLHGGALSTLSSLTRTRLLTSGLLTILGREKEREKERKQTEKSGVQKRRGSFEGNEEGEGVLLLPPLPLAIGLRVCLEIALHVRRLEDFGVMHREVSPSNVWVYGSLGSNEVEVCLGNPALLATANRNTPLSALTGGNSDFLPWELRCFSRDCACPLRKKRTSTNMNLMGQRRQLSEGHERERQPDAHRERGGFGSWLSGSARGIGVEREAGVSCSGHPYFPHTVGVYNPSVSALLCTVNEILGGPDRTLEFQHRHTLLKGIEQSRERDRKNSQTDARRLFISASCRPLPLSVFLYHEDLGLKPLFLRAFSSNLGGRPSIDETITGLQRAADVVERLNTLINEGAPRSTLLPLLPVSSQSPNKGTAPGAPNQREKENENGEIERRLCWGEVEQTPYVPPSASSPRRARKAPVNKKDTKKKTEKKKEGTRSRAQSVSVSERSQRDGATSARSRKGSVRSARSRKESVRSPSTSPRGMASRRASLRPPLSARTPPGSARRKSALTKGEASRRASSMRPSTSAGKTQFPSQTQLDDTISPEAVDAEGRGGLFSLFWSLIGLSNARGEGRQTSSDSNELVSKAAKAKQSVTLQPVSPSSPVQDSAAEKAKGEGGKGVRNRSASVASMRRSSQGDMLTSARGAALRRSGTTGVTDGRQSVSPPVASRSSMAKQKAKPTGRSSTSTSPLLPPKTRKQSQKSAVVPKRKQRPSEVEREREQMGQLEETEIPEEESAAAERNPTQSISSQNVPVIQPAAVGTGLQSNQLEEGCVQQHNQAQPSTELASPLHKLQTNELPAPLPEPKSIPTKVSQPDSAVPQQTHPTRIQEHSQNEKETEAKKSELGVSPPGQPVEDQASPSQKETDTAPVQTDQRLSDQNHQPPPVHPSGLGASPDAVAASADLSAVQLASPAEPVAPQTSPHDLSQPPPSEPPAPQSTSIFSGLWSAFRGSPSPPAATDSNKETLPQQTSKIPPPRLQSAPPGNTSSGFLPLPHAEQPTGSQQISLQIPPTNPPNHVPQSSAANAGNITHTHVLSDVHQPTTTTSSRVPLPPGTQMEKPQITETPPPQQETPTPSPESHHPVEGTQASPAAASGSLFSTLFSVFGTSGTVPKAPPPPPRPKSAPPLPPPKPALTPTSPSPPPVSVPSPDKASEVPQKGETSSKAPPADDVEVSVKAEEQNEQPNAEGEKVKAQPEEHKTPIDHSSEGPSAPPLRDPASSSSADLKEQTEAAAEVTVTNAVEAKPLETSKEALSEEKKEESPQEKTCEHKSTASPKTLSGVTLTKEKAESLNPGVAKEKSLPGPETNDQMDTRALETPSVAVNERASSSSPSGRDAAEESHMESAGPLCQPKDSVSAEHQTATILAETNNATLIERVPSEEYTIEGPQEPPFPHATTAPVLKSTLYHETVNTENPGTTAEVEPASPREKESPTEQDNQRDGTNHAEGPNGAASQILTLAGVEGQKTLASASEHADVSSPPFQDLQALPQRKEDADDRSPLDDPLQLQSDELERSAVREAAEQKKEKEDSEQEGGEGTVERQGGKLTAEKVSEMSKQEVPDCPPLCLQKEATREEPSASAHDVVSPVAESFPKSWTDVHAQKETHKEERAQEEDREASPNPVVLQPGRSPSSPRGESRRVSLAGSSLYALPLNEKGKEDFRRGSQTSNARLKEDEGGGRRRMVRVEQKKELGTLAPIPASRDGIEKREEEGEWSDESDKEGEAQEGEGGMRGGPRGRIGRKTAINFLYAASPSLGLSLVSDPRVKAQRKGKRAKATPDLSSQNNERGEVQLGKESAGAQKGRKVKVVKRKRKAVGEKGADSVPFPQVPDFWDLRLDAVGDALAVFWDQQPAGRRRRRKKGKGKLKRAEKQSVTINEEKKEDSHREKASPSPAFVRRRATGQRQSIKIRGGKAGKNKSQQQGKYDNHEAPSPSQHPQTLQKNPRDLAQPQNSTFPHPSTKEKRPEENEDKKDSSGQQEAAEVEKNEKAPRGKKKKAKSKPPPLPSFTRPRRLSRPLPSAPDDQKPSVHLSTTAAPPPSVVLPSEDPLNVLPPDAAPPASQVPSLAGPPPFIPPLDLSIIAEQRKERKPIRGIQVVRQQQQLEDGANVKIEGAPVREEEKEKPHDKSPPKQNFSLSPSPNLPFLFGDQSRPSKATVPVEEDPAKEFFGNVEKTFGLFLNAAEANVSMGIAAAGAAAAAQAPRDTRETSDGLEGHQKFSTAAEPRKVKQRGSVDSQQNPERKRKSINKSKDVQTGKVPAQGQPDIFGLDFGHFFGQGLFAEAGTTAEQLPSGHVNPVNQPLSDLLAEDQGRRDRVALQKERAKVKESNQKRH
uniref:Protein kinase domain-containing protein n=1 Tax=Chromera velia CCMP2878 TaxID=1169474 RepID=A0A0G4G2Q8_9ALVE|eukprot:Cvel_19842.t1-p1 / transcript=Cvel_19842.t1 / gene=Cvel_19842 / organism=Chromera_velia_CCMP2878 / gene_product=hypothetical protein / transcript_product=hypothetical protein / location=Cvel_scaffold1737:13455-22994(+) / protein_length=2624 / sequence_SO=supercontig / SO=protein_coding / is_pseudo=false